ncbi:hypothetical protein H2200_010112 [Cladophialophora chaetospira]|uniref:Stress-response A/B barrel domain-containing protein n=1 Tax=Cladophialophora chaetospira TaxID=386627 RepID=A0AA38X2C8_9EURO|nr:hypothetical protein H2200_010112 [Cladophialophora chaetospira]
MPLYHVVLMKPKPEVTQAQLAEFASTGQAMVGKIPGLRSFKSGQPLPSTASRSQGFSMAVVAVLEKAEELEAYTSHPVHVSFHERFKNLYEDMLAYDMEFSE